jgi:hypothetical protein
MATRRPCERRFGGVFWAGKMPGLRDDVTIFAILRNCGHILKPGDILPLSPD